MPTKQFCSAILIGLTALASPVQSEARSKDAGEETGWQTTEDQYETIRLGEASTVPPLTPLGELFDLSGSQAPDGLLDALASGRITLRSKLRLWHANASDAGASEAFSFGARIGYLTQDYKGFQAFVEGNHVEVFTPNDFFDGVNDNTDLTLIADVEQTELNQAWVQYGRTDREFAFNLRVGRQATAAIDERFIGSSGSRQGEQTFDAIAFASRFGSGRRFSFEYGYIDKVQRIFDVDALDYQSESHTLRLGYVSDGIGTISAFALLLDFKDSAPQLSNQTYGISIDQRQVASDRVSFVYSLGFAVQSDYGSNPTDYSATSFYAEGGVAVPDFGVFSLGYELSSSDGGEASFQYSLTTGQRVHRLSDTFIATPDDGLQDFFVNYELPNSLFGLVGELNFHYYRSEQDGRDLGTEYNLNLTKLLSPNLSATLLASYFDTGSTANPDLFQANLEINFSF